MVCVYCGQKTTVSNSRRQLNSNQVWRRRHCLSCGADFTTREAADYQKTWVVRSAKALQPFSRDKLLLSLYESCQHRKAALSDAQGLVNTIISKLGQHYLQDGSLAAHDITKVAQVSLNRFDKAASVHYAAHHRG